MSIGLSELILIIIVIICVINPQNAAKIANSLGRSFHTFKQFSKQTSEELSDRKEKL